MGEWEGGCGEGLGRELNDSAVISNQKEYCTELPSYETDKAA